MEEIILKYIGENWIAVLSAIGTAFVCSISGCWAFAKMWYARQLTLKDAKFTIICNECDMLKMKIREKDSYIQAVIEVMDQRLNLAKEEPQRLRLLIEEKEKQLVELISEKDSLIKKIEDSKSSEDVTQIVSYVSNMNIRNLVRNTINHDYWNSTRNINLINIGNAFRSWDKKTSEKSNNLKEVTSYLLLWTQAQAMENAELDIGLKHCYRDLFSLRQETFNSLTIMLKPFTQGSKNNQPKFNYFMTNIPSHLLEDYLKIAKDLEKKGREESDINQKKSCDEKLPKKE